MTVSVALHTLEEPTGLHLSCRRCRIRLWWIPIPQLTCASYTTNVPDTSHTRGSSGSRSRSRCIIWICCRGKRLCICKWYFISWYDCGGIYIFALMSLCVSVWLCLWVWNRNKYIRAITITITITIEHQQLFYSNSTSHYLTFEYRWPN